MPAITPSQAPSQAQAQRRIDGISTKQAQQQPVPPEQPEQQEPFKKLPSDMYWTIADFLPRRDGVHLKISNQGAYKSMINQLIPSDIRTINKEALKYILKLELCLWVKKVTNIIQQNFVVEHT